ncbi:MAG: cadherin-like domain-containing protein, partial [Pseudomonadota bacterium]
TNDRWVWEFNNSVATPNGQEGWTLGLTGHMSNFIDDHFNDVVALSGVLDGGIAGRLQIEFDAVGSGSPIGTDNDATYFLQTGVTIGGSVDEFVVESTMLNPWASSGGAIDGDNLGVHWGSGTQFDFVYLAAEIQNGVGQITMTIELNDEIYYSQTYAAPGLTDIANNSTITLRTHVDVVNGTVTPTWSYETDDAAGGANGVVFGTGQSVSLDDDGDPNTQNVLEEVISGTYNVRNAPVDGEPGDPIFGQFFSGVPSGIAIGVGGARGSTAQTPPTSFAPEFDDLVFATSKANGNFEPVANGDGFGGATVGETFTIAVADLLANDVDYDIGDALTVTGVSNPSGGMVSLANGVVSFTPSAAGANSFDYTVSDGQNASTATVIVSTDAGGGGGPAREVVYRINAGGPEVAAIDGGRSADRAGPRTGGPEVDPGDCGARARSPPGGALSLYCLSGRGAWQSG